MFFVSGLFINEGLVRKGVGRSLADRARRLGVPFIFAVGVLMPIAYYASWRMSNQAQMGGFLIRFFTVDGWPVGPPWFLWILLAFSAIAALIYWAYPRTWERMAFSPKSGVSLALLFFFVTLIAVEPLRLIVSPDSWATFGGPFDFQTSRVLLYFSWFILGSVVAKGNLSKALSPGNLRLWPLWMIVGLISFAGHWLLSGPTALTNIPSWAAHATVGLVFSICCASTGLGIIGLVRQVVKRALPGGDSLSANAYGIYIIHYLFVVWIQFVLLSAPIPAVVKFVLVFSIALAASWLLTAALRGTAAKRFL